MTAFAIRRRTDAGMVTCVNGCMSVNGGYREAAVYAIFLDRYRVALCPGCSKAWRAAWESARPADVEAVAA